MTPFGNTPRSPISRSKRAAGRTDINTSPTSWPTPLASVTDTGSIRHEKMSSSGVEPDPRPSQGRMRSPTPQGQSQISNLNSQIPITSPGNRTQSDGLKVRYADHHTGEVLRNLKLQISNLRTTPPRSRTSSDSFERCRASVTLAGRNVNPNFQNPMSNE